MEKQSIQNIAQALADKYELTPKQSETFLREFFDVVKNGLTKDGIVKIKGLGTFKLVDVDARESINVNTGERVVIEGHNKVTFTPEAVLRDIINKPFSEFQTVILNPGVDLNSLDTSSVGIDDINPDPFAFITDDSSVGNNVSPESAVGVLPTSGDSSQASVGIQASTEEMELPDENQKRPSGENEADAFSEAVSENDKEVKSPAESPKPQENSQENHEGLNDVQAEKPDDDIVETKNLESKDIPAGDGKSEDANHSELVKTNEDAGEDEEPQMDDENEETVLEFEDTPSDDTSKRHFGKCLKISLISFVSLLALFICFAAGYMVGSHSNISSVIQSALGTQAPTAKSVPSRQQKTTRAKKVVAALPQGTSTDHDSAVATSTVESKTATSTKGKSLSSAKSVDKSETAIGKSESSFDSDKYDKFSNEVRTGAYRIIGIKKVITLKPNETVYGYAARHLGNRSMACYIYALNGVRGEKEIKAGRQIKIPVLELRHKRHHSNQK
jgi:nucleoid DNA-binding protein